MLSFRGLRLCLFLLAALSSGAVRAQVVDGVGSGINLSWNGKRYPFVSTTPDHSGRLEFDSQGVAFYRLDRVEDGSSSVRAQIDVSESQSRWIKISAEIRGKDAVGQAGVGYRVLDVGGNVLASNFDYSTCPKSLEAWSQCDSFVRLSDRAKSLLVIVGAPFSSELDFRGVEARSLGNEELSPLDGKAAEETQRIFSSAKSMFFRTSDINWAEVRDACQPTQIPQDYDPIVPFARCLAARLGDPHTRVFKQPVASAYSIADRPSHDIRRIKPTIGYVKLANAGVAPGAQVLTYSRPSSARIRALLSEGVTDWIVDLRGNQGGNVYAMLAASAPLIGSSRKPLAYWEYATGESVPIRLTANGAKEGKVVQAAVEKADRVARGVHAVVLVDKGCVSSCEILAMVLEARKCTKLVGQPTGGLNTSVDDLDVQGRYKLAITTAFVLDSARRRRYPNILPAVVHSNDDGEWLAAAEGVLKGLSDCASR